MQMMGSELAGRVAIVTEAAQGLGLATAGALVEAGARLLLADVQGDKVQAAAGHLLSKNGGCVAVGVELCFGRDAGGHGSSLRRTLTPRTSHHSRRWWRR